MLNLRQEYVNVQFGHDCKPTSNAKWIAMLFWDLHSPFGLLRV